MTMEEDHSGIIWDMLAAHIYLVRYELAGKLILYVRSFTYLCLDEGLIPTLDLHVPDRV